MKMLKVMEKRRSVREYKEKQIGMEELDQLMRILQSPVSLEPGHDAELVFVEDGDMVHSMLDGIAGYNGVMIKAPHYFAVLAEEKPNFLTNAGYLAEWFVLNATKLNLGTCWIETFEKSETAKNMLQMEDRRVLVALIAIGYPKAEHRVSNIFQGKNTSGLSPYTETGYADKSPEYSDAPVSARLSIEEIVYSKKWGTPATVEMLESYGLAEAFYYMHLAPSWGNLQPWRFIVDGQQIILTILKDNPFKNDEADVALAAIEAGIAMLYFQVAMHDLGLPGQWSLDAVSDAYSVPEGYLAAGTYRYQ